MKIPRRLLLPLPQENGMTAMNGTVMSICCNCMPTLQSRKAIKRNRKFGKQNGSESQWRKLVYCISRCRDRNDLNQISETTIREQIPKILVYDIRDKEPETSSDTASNNTTHEPEAEQEPTKVLVVRYLSPQEYMEQHRYSEADKKLGGVNVQDYQGTGKCVIRNTERAPISRVDALKGNDILLDRSNQPIQNINAANAVIVCLGILVKRKDHFRVMIVNLLQRCQFSL